MWTTLTNALAVTLNVPQLDLLVIYGAETRAFRLREEEWNQVRTKHVEF